MDGRSSLNEMAVSFQPSFPNPFKPRGNKDRRASTRSYYIMIKPDLLTVIPRDVDFPLFRYNLERFKKYFDQIYIAINDNGFATDYSDFFITSIPFAHFKKTPRGGGDVDWRNVAMNTLLDKSTADWVLFLEPDFLIRDDRFFEVLLNVSDYDFIFYEEGERIHPACALLPRHIIERTSKDFSARPPAHDHFGQFFKQASLITNSADLETIGLRDKEDYVHIAGVTQSYHAKPFHKPNQFLTYNRLCLKLPVQFNEFRQTMESIDTDPSNPFFHDAPVASMFPKEDEDKNNNT